MRIKAEYSSTDASPRRFPKSSDFIRNLPEGESRIAHPFKRGLSGEMSVSPEGTVESIPQARSRMLSRPFGTNENTNSNPAVNCRAIFGSPFGRLGAQGFVRTQAFTMIEIALSVAIVAFALVGILGVLPTGMRVQKDNREDTIVNQDGLFLIDAIRGNARTLDELTNYVESITISNSPAPWGPGKSIEITNFAGGEEIIGLLTTLRTPILYSSPVPSTTLTFVKARMRSITGGAGDKGGTANEFAFRYQVIAETVPVEIVPPVSVQRLQNLASTLPNGSVERLQIGEEIAKIYNLNNYMFDVRLTLLWPMYERGNKWQVGRFRKTFRTVIAGTLSTNTLFKASRNLTFVVPNTFTNYIGTNNFFQPYAL